LMIILQDQGAAAAVFIPTNYIYSLSGMPTASGNFIIQKSSGAYQILLWNETPFWSNSTGLDVSVTPSTVTVTLPANGNGKVYDPINSGTTPIATFSKTSSVVVSLGASPLIVEIDVGGGLVNFNKIGYPH
jgi:hypothetical protein